MKRIKSYSVETMDTRFIVDIHQEPSGTFIADYSGTKPRFAQAVRSGAPMPLTVDVPGGRIKGDDVDELLGHVRDEITRRFGKIEMSIEL